MRTKNFLLTICVIISLSLIFVIFGQDKPESIHDIVSTTNEQIRNFKVGFASYNNKITTFQRFIIR